MNYEYLAMCIMKNRYYPFLYSLHMYIDSHYDIHRVIYSVSFYSFMDHKHYLSFTKLSQLQSPYTRIYNQLLIRNRSKLETADFVKLVTANNPFFSIFHQNIQYARFFFLTKLETSFS